MADIKKVNYLNKDFGSFKNSLMDFAKNYFPNTYNDFNPSSPGMMFIEMAAYVGDVLSYYIDDQMKELLMAKAERKENVLLMSQALGYKPSTTTVATTKLDFFQVVPAITTGSDYRPNYDQAVNLKEGIIVQSTTNSEVTYRTSDKLIFSANDSLDNAPEVTVYTMDEYRNPSEYLLKKSVWAESVGEETITMSAPTGPKRFTKILLPRTNIVNIVQVKNKDEDIYWYEVPYLAQDTIFIDEPNDIDPDTSEFQSSIPYLLRLKKVGKRYITHVRPDNKIELHFGTGVSTDSDEEIIPNPYSVGSGLPQSKSSLETAIDPANFLYTKTYGEMPYGIDLEITYTYGGGIESNVPSKDLTTIVSSMADFVDKPESPLQSVLDSIACTNPEPGIGGRSGENVDEIRQNALSYFSTQQRAVTKEDYIVRAYSLPSKYGSVAKAYITQDMQLDPKQADAIGQANPLAIDLYCLGYDQNKNLTLLNQAIKENLRAYIDRYRMVTDGINLLNAFIINIGVEFDIISLPQYNKNEVLLRCINEVKEYFNIDKWQINQPIIVSEIVTLLLTVEGVRNVNDVRIVNKWDQTLGYSGNAYSISEATMDGIVYPSKDPSIFELKYYNQDIIGKSK